MDTKKKSPNPKLKTSIFIVFVLIALILVAIRVRKITLQDTNTPIPQPTTTEEPLRSTRTYASSDFLYQFEYPEVFQGCDNKLSVSTLWVMSENVYGIDIYCNKGANLFQVITQKTNKEPFEWWYSLTPESKSFFDEYGEKKDVTFAGQKATQVSYQKNGNNDHYNQVEIVFQKGGINYLVVALDLLCSQEDSCWQAQFEQQVLESFELFDAPITTITPTVYATATPTNIENLVCGGILGRTCPQGYTCEYDADYPDATGKCVKN